MKLKELIHQGTIDEPEFQYYQEKEIFPLAIGSETKLTDTQIELLSTIAFFREAGLCKEQIVEYIQSSPNQKERQIWILRNLRCQLLNHIHEKGKILDKIDYILYELQSKE